MTDPKPTPEDQVAATALLEKIRGWTHRGMLYAVMGEIARVRAEQQERDAKICDALARQEEYDCMGDNDRTPAYDRAARDIRAQGPT